MLDAALTATDGDEGFDLALTVRNEGDEPVTLRFHTGQRADFAAYESNDADRDGRDVDGIDPDDEAIAWRHGAGRLFTQVLGSETLTPGASVTYEATWSDPSPGSYHVVGVLTAEEHDIAAMETVAVE